MRDTCTCGASFRTGEDWRDHMPCPGSEVERLRERIAVLTDMLGEIGERRDSLHAELDEVRAQGRRRLDEVTRNSGAAMMNPMDIITKQDRALLATRQWWLGECNYAEWESAMVAYFGPPPGGFDDLAGTMALIVEQQDLQLHRLTSEGVELRWERNDARFNLCRALGLPHDADWAHLGEGVNKLAERVRVLEGLARFARHAPGCRHGCDCGFDRAVEEAGAT